MNVKTYKIELVNIDTSIDHNNVMIINSDCSSCQLRKLLEDTNGQPVNVVIFSVFANSSQIRPLINKNYNFAVYIDYYDQLNILRSKLNNQNVFRETRLEDPAR